MAGNGGGSLLPAELQACEYLETDGDSYIYTGLGGKNYSSFELKFSVSGENSGNSIVFGSRNGNISYLIYPAIDYDEFRVWYNTQQQYFSIDLKNNKNFIVKGENNIFKIYDFNDNLLHTFTFSNYSFSFGMQILLFGAQLPSISKAQAGTRIYNNKIENLRDYVACYIKIGQTFTDNKGNICGAETCGMYDVVNNVFYTNDGSGQFTHGSDINF